MDFEALIYQVERQVATITLNRPGRLNAVTKQLDDELYTAMKAADEDDEVRVIILTGAGRGFCAGADLEALAWVADIDWSSVEIDQLREKILPLHSWGEGRSDFQKTYSYFPAIAKPIIAAINGPAVGLGFILSLYCDIRFASEKTRFGTAFAKRGLVAEHGVSWILPRLVGLSNALDLLYSARLIDAEEAQRMGLVSRIVSHDQLMVEVREYAIQLATAVSPRSLRVMKRQVYDSLLQSLDESIEKANDEMIQSFQCEDFQEGVAHFMEKRPPKFTGR